MPPGKRKKRAKPELAVAEQVVPAVQLMPHQLDALAAFDAGRRNQSDIWHRRAGKDWFGMFLGARQARTEIGTYWHLLPKHIQAKRAIWNGIDHKSGKRFLELFFPDAVGVNNTEMFIELECGSTWQLLGSDNYDRMVGSNPRGVVFSEWALCDPMAWEYIRPILRANGGWAVFITTFRGRNHAYQMHKTVQNLPDWYASLRTVRDTGIITEEQVNQDRLSGMSERLIKQEYYCEPAAPVSLGPYARVLDALDSAGRVHIMPQTFKDGAERYIAYANVDGYCAAVDYAKRGAVGYVYGGAIDRNVAPHEILAPYLTDIRNGRVRLICAEDQRRELAEGLGASVRVQHSPATTARTATLLEQAIVDPASVAYAALTNSLGSKLDEEADDERATAATLLALELLAAGVPSSTEWGPRPNYRNHDLAVVGSR